MTETKNEALELAQELEEAAGDFGLFGKHMGHGAADMLRSQASEIERLTTERDMSRWTLKNLDDAEAKESMYQVGLTQEREITNLTKERDQLKAVIEQLNQSNTSRLMQILVDDKVVLQERVGQLKAKDQKLVEALRELMGWQVKNVNVWSNSAYDNASRSLKENT